MQAGSIVVALAAWAIIPWLGWRWFAVACGIPPLVSACLVAGFVLESPRFLLAQGHAAEAAAVVEHMFRRNGVALRSRTREVELQENVASPEEDGEQDVRGGRRQLLALGPVLRPSTLATPLHLPAGRRGADASQGKPSAAPE